MTCPQTVLTSESEHLRAARIALRSVDIALKSQGLAAARRALKTARRACSASSTIQRWLDDYAMLLTVWQSGQLPCAWRAFRRYGFRRARQSVSISLARSRSERKVAAYAACCRALEQMAERFRLSLQDEPENCPALLAQTLSELQKTR